MSAALLCAFARALGFAARAPGFGRAGVPAPVRAGFAAALALGCAPAVHLAPIRDVAAFALLIAGEVVTGVLFGMTAGLVVDAAGAAGGLLDELVGIRVSLPNATVGEAGFGRLWSLAFVVALFGGGGIDALLGAFMHSFSVVPPGGLFGPARLAPVALRWAGDLGRIAVMLAAPAAAACLAVQCVLAAVGRIAPRCAALGLGTPAAFAAVTALAALALARDLPGAGAVPAVFEALTR